MSTFKLTTFRQPRLYTCAFLTPVALIASLILGALFNSFFLGLIVFCFFLFISYYIIIGHLNVTIENDVLYFSWEKKFLFNYKEISPVNVKDIKFLVIDNGDLFRKLITTDRTIYLNTAKFKQNDIHKFIYNLEVLAKDQNIRRISSWREWKEKGYLKIAYKINVIVLVFGVIAVLFAIITKGFSGKFLLIALLWVPQLIFYGKQMKQELND